MSIKILLIKRKMELDTHKIRIFPFSTDFIDYFGVHLKRKLRSKIPPLFRALLRENCLNVCHCRATNPALKS